MSYKAVISGRVQGVSFRVSMREIARRHGVRGWVKNRSDGAVEALIQGEEAKVVILLEWARFGPPGAEVVSVKSERLQDCPRQSEFRVLVDGQGRRRAVKC